VRGPVNCCYLRSAWKAELYLTFMSRLREQDFIEISITYMNNNEFKHIGKQSNIRESNNLETNLEHIINLAEVKRISIYVDCDTKSCILTVQRRY